MCLINWVHLIITKKNTHTKTLDKSPIAMCVLFPLVQVNTDQVSAAKELHKDRIQITKIIALAED